MIQMGLLVSGDNGLLRSCAENCVLNAILNNHYLTVADELLSLNSNVDVLYGSLSSQFVDAYTEDVAEKYGKNGTVITFDTDDAGLIWMQYSYYPTAYRQDISAAFYSRSYAASQKLEEGFLLCRTGSKPVQYKDSTRLIQLIHGEQ